jgi:hypothetical protein
VNKNFMRGYFVVVRMPAVEVDIIVARVLHYQPVFRIELN